MISWSGAVLTSAAMGTCLLVAGAVPVGGGSARPDDTLDLADPVTAYVLEGGPGGAEAVAPAVAGAAETTAETGGPFAGLSPDGFSSHSTGTVLPEISANQRLPSGPGAMPAGRLMGVGMANSSTDPVLAPAGATAARTSSVTMSQLTPRLGPVAIRIARCPLRQTPTAIVLQGGPRLPVALDAVELRRHQLRFPTSANVCANQDGLLLSALRHSICYILRCG